MSKRLVRLPAMRPTASKHSRRSAFFGMSDVVMSRIASQDHGNREASPFPPVSASMDKPQIPIDGASSGSISLSVMTAPSDHRIRLFLALCLGLIGDVAAVASVYATPARGASTLSCGLEASKPALW
jgi:hypothetical protein